MLQHETDVYGCLRCYNMLHIIGIHDYTTYDEFDFNKMTSGSLLRSGHKGPMYIIIGLALYF